MITIYTKENCGACSKAKALLQARGLEYKEIQIGKDVMREHVMELFPNAKQVPIIIDRGNFIGGYDQLKEKILVEDRQFLTEVNNF